MRSVLIALLGLIFVFFILFVFLLLYSSKNQTNRISSLCPESVKYWERKIIQYSGDDIPPNFLAMIMIMESCGDPTIVADNMSDVGLLQINHQIPGRPSVEELLDPDINFAQGVKHLRSCAVFTDNYGPLTFACYNGGHGNISKPQDEWIESIVRYMNAAWEGYQYLENNDSIGFTKWMKTYRIEACDRSLLRLKITLGR